MDRHETHSRRHSAEFAVAAAADGNRGAKRRSLDPTTDQDGSNDTVPLLHQTAEYDVPALPPVGDTTLTSSLAGSLDSQDLESGHGGDETKSSWYLFLLTLSIGGLQIAWAVELSNGSPYLLSLGISKSLLAFVWIAGPLSGTLVQPYVGMTSDRCRSRFGKRRPFMVGGAVATVISLLVLAWTSEIVSAILESLFKVAPGSDGTKVTAIVVAIIMIYILDFSINTIQAAIRAFIVDNAPTHQQDPANAWAARVAGVGNIVGYLFGYVDLPKYFWFFGDTQFKVLCVLASLMMLSTLAISCINIQERDPRLDAIDEDKNGGVLQFFKDLYYSVRKLPKQIKAVCIVQFFAWIGWFPFLFYITTYVAEIYAQPIFSLDPQMTQAEIDATWERATRMGTFALFMFAITTFAASVVLPFVVGGSSLEKEPLSPAHSSIPGRDRLAEHASGERGYYRLAAGTQNSDFKLRGLTLTRAWLISHVLFAVLMFLTFFVHNTRAAGVLVALVGIPWAMTNWAPFALIAEDISRRDNLRRTLDPRTDLEDRHDDRLGVHDNDERDGHDQAGVVLGIHNVAIAAPQIIATLVSSAIFQSMQKPRGSVGDESVAWVLRFGGLAALIAAWFTRRVEEKKT